MQQAAVLVAGAPLTTAAFVRASCLVSGRRAGAGRRSRVGILVCIPFPVLDRAFILPGLAWLAFMGLAVPVAVVERRRLPRVADPRAAAGHDGLRPRARRRSRRSSIVYGLTSGVLLVLLHGQADAALRAALFLTDLARVADPLRRRGAPVLRPGGPSTIGPPTEETRCRSSCC